MILNRARFFAVFTTGAFLLPIAIPTVGLDWQYFFVLAIVLFAWFIIKWESVKAIKTRGTSLEALAGIAVIAAVYAYKAFQGSPVGILDLLIVFLASVVVAFGPRSLKFFWVPSAYVVILLVGYQVEIYTPNYVVLQDWLAGIMVSSLTTLGIGATLTGHLVALNTSSGPLLLDVASECTGLQGILAFGLLSTMALLDFKPRKSRMIPIFAVGFIGAFLINIVRLLVVFLTFEYFGIDAGSTMHVYFGYLIFIVWVLAFWAIAFKYLAPSRGVMPIKAPLPAQLPSGY